MLAGLDLDAAALVGLCVALSSSVVIVNITVSRRRTTDRPTDIALLGWAVMQDLVGVVLGAILLALFAPTDRSLPATLLGLVLFGVMAVAGRPDPASGPASPPRRARPVPDHLGRHRTDARRDRRGGLRGAAGARGLRRRARGRPTAARRPKRVAGCSPSGTSSRSCSSSRSERWWIPARSSRGCPGSCCCWP